MTDTPLDEISAGGVNLRSAFWPLTTDTGEEESPESLPDRYHHSFISLFSLAVQLKIDFLDVTWQPALQPLGTGASSEISASNMLTKNLTFAFKRTVARPDQMEAAATTIDKARLRSLICEILVLTHPAIREHPNVTSLLGISWEFHEGTVWPVPAVIKSSKHPTRPFPKPARIGTYPSRPRSIRPRVAFSGSPRPDRRAPRVGEMFRHRFFGKACNGLSRGGAAR